MTEWDVLERMNVNELLLLAKEVFHKANYRLARLGEYRPQSEAYHRLLSFKGAPYIDEHDYYSFKIPDIDRADVLIKKLQQGIGVAENFLESKTSTKAGMKKVQANRRKWVRQNFNGFERNAAADDFLKFLGSDEIRSQMQTFDSNIIVEALATAGSNQPSKKLQEIYNEFKASGKSWGGFLIDQEESWRKRKGIKF